MLIKDFVRFQVNKEYENIDISHLTIDSRECQKGSLYFAINGTRVDGHNFIENAYKAGASAAIVERKVDCPIPQITVENTRSAMSYIASAFYSFPARKLKVIGITGTNGKTSISYMIKSICRQNGISCGVIGTSGIYVDDKKLDIKILTSTTPDPIELQKVLSEMVKLGAKWVVMEVTAHALDLHKVDGMSFASGGFTNLTQDHLDYFVTMENYANAKAKLFEKEVSATGVINLNDEFGRKLYKIRKIPMLTYSVNGEADLTAQDVKIENHGSSFSVKYKNELYPVKTKTTGLFNISNVLCSIGCGINAGLNICECIKGIENFSSVPGRFETVDTHNLGFTVVVDYAHTPDGLENILSSINSFKKGKLICVFGCGGNRDSAKRPVMGELSGKLSDYVVLTSDNPRLEEPESIIDSIEEGIKKTNCQYTRNQDRKEAIKYAIEMAEKDDIIAICGKGDEDYQDIQGVKYHFSDREVAEELISRRMK